MSYKRDIPWTSQPQYPVKVDRSKSTGVNIGSCVIAGNPADIVRNLSAACSPIVATRNGKAHQAGTTTPIAYGTTNYYPLAASTSFTVLAVIPYAALAGTNPGLFRDGSASSGGTFCIVQGANKLPWMRVNSIDVLKPTSGPALVVGQNLVIAYRFTNATEASVFWDGKKQHTATTSTNAVSVGIYNVGYQNSQAEYIGDVAAFMVWPRALGDAELCELTRTPQSPWSILEPLKRNIYVSAASGLSAALGLNTETDTALAIATAKSLALGIASETDTAQSLTASKSVALGLVTEADSAQSITTAKALGLGLNTETDTAQPLVFGLSATLGLASETDTAQALTTAKTLAAGLATEADTPLALSASKALSIGLGTETDTAQAITAAKSLTLGLASETDTAIALGAGLSAPLGLVTDTGTAQPITASKSITLGIVTEAEFAQAITYYKSIGVLQAAETGSVFGVAVQKTITLGLASETDSALALVFDTGTGDPPDAIFTVPSERRIFTVASERRIFHS